MTAAIISQPVLQMKSVHLQDNPMNTTTTHDSSTVVEEEIIAHDEADEMALLEGPYSRLVGDTEHNWCRAVGSGTGITVLSLLFSRVVDASSLQQAVRLVQLQHPRLRSQLLWIQGRPAFKVSENPCVNVDVVNATSSPLIPDEGGDTNPGNGDEWCKDGEKDQITAKEWCTAELQDGENHEWMLHVEAELNVNMWPEHQHCLEPAQMFVVRLYLLPENKSLLVLRVHTAVCDRVAATTVLADILNALRDTTAASATAKETHAMVAGSSSWPSSPAHQFNSDSAIETDNLRSVEDGIPPGKANKPFWAHGIDLLGYSLGTRRHALLPFDEPNAPRRSKFFHSILSVEHTKLLLETCEKKSSSVHAALCAAGMKAAAAIKSLGKRSEHFAIVSFVNCRQFLQPELSDSTVGFYHSALLNTHHVNEQTDFWELAKRSSGSLEDAMRHRKHFTDMGDLNFLMFQALQHPGLTPSSSMRTSLLVVFRDTVVDKMEDLAEALGIEHYIGCSSIHGVGPSLAIFDDIRKGALHFSGVYPTPLYSRAQMHIYMRLMVDILVQSLEN